MASKLEVGANDTVLLIPALEIDGIPYGVGATAVAYDELTNAIYNRYIPITTAGATNAGHGGNITCAIRDDWNLALTDSGTDDDRTLCSRGPNGEFLEFNFDAEFTLLRDESLTDNTSEFNYARDLTRAADIPYLIAHRVGYDRLTPSAVGHEWNIYYVWTDNPVPVYSDGGNQAVSQTFVPKNVIAWKNEVTA